MLDDVVSTEVEVVDDCIVEVFVGGTKIVGDIDEEVVLLELESEPWSGSKRLSKTDAGLNCGDVAGESSSELKGDE